MKALLLLLVIVTLFSTGNALRCYQCAEPQSTCNDPFDETRPGVNEVSYPAGCACVKAVITLSFATLTLRNCTDPSKLLRGSSVSSMFSSRLDVTTIKSVSANFCYTDLCNGASSISVALSTLIVLAVPFVVQIWH